MFWFPARRERWSGEARRGLARLMLLVLQQQVLWLLMLMSLILLDLLLLRLLLSLLMTLLFLPLMLRLVLLLVSAAGIALAARTMRHDLAMSKSRRPRARKRASYIT